MVSLLCGSTLNICLNIVGILSQSLAFSVSYLTSLLHLPGKAANSTVCCPATPVGTRIECLASVFSQPRCGCCRHLGSKLVDRKSSNQSQVFLLALSPSFSLPPPYLFFFFFFYKQGEVVSDFLFCALGIFYCITK